MYITILQGLTFVLYVTFIVNRFGILPSISESWYRLEGLQKSLFTFFCWSIGGLMLFQTNGDTGYFFLSGAGLSFVGAATMFKTDEAKSNYVHPIGAVSGIIGAHLGIIFERHIYIPSIIFVIFYLSIILFVKRNKMWWIEIFAFITILIGLFLH